MDWWGIALLAGIVLGIVLYTGAIGGRGTTITKADFPGVYAVGVLGLSGLVVFAVLKALGYV